MASSTAKKVRVARFDRDPISGFVTPAGYLTAQGIEILTLTATVIVLTYDEVKAVHFVRDFEDGPVRLERSTFLARPKIDGLWVRLVFRDGDVLEAVVPNNLLQFEQFGFTVTPPDYTSNNQKLFVPKTALTEMKVLGVVGSPLRRKAKEAGRDQIKLFE